MPNHLIDQSSPYLQQHAENPVDWYPWCEQALQRSVAEDKPIFLSIGYSACHWCHVMEHESFENETIAQYLNDNFISIKVDREERPDLDTIYMNAVMAIRNGQGGWPLNVFLTPDCDFFYGGTYWPPEARMGMPGFDHVLHSVIDTYRNKRDAVAEQSKRITQWLNQPETRQPDQPLAESLLASAAMQLENQFDESFGGFGTAPKFPHATDLSLLLRIANRCNETSSPPQSRLLEMVHRSLSKMAQGGIYDHLGGGFARYSVDQRWLVPHFEKMLYDNALLTTAYLEMVQFCDDPFFATVAGETIEYVRRDMTDAGGAFFSAEDADSEGVEGKFYVWSKSEIKQHVAADIFDTLCEYYDVTESGNFEGHNILNTPIGLIEFAATKGIDADSFQAEIIQAKSALLTVRGDRVRPGLDDKIITSWNGMMIAALARSSVVLDRQEDYTAATNAADFILNHMRSNTGRLLHTCRHGKATLMAYLDDYACFIDGLMQLYQANFDGQYLDAACELADQMVEFFHDEADGGFFFTANDHEKLIARTKPFSDNSVPSGNGMAATALIQLGRMLGDAEWIRLAERTLQCCVELIRRSPLATGQSLIAVDSILHGGQEIVLAGSESSQLLLWAQRIKKKFLPNTVVIVNGPAVPERLQSIVQDKGMIDQQPTMYVCENFTCQVPIVGGQNIDDAIDKL